MIEIVAISVVGIVAIVAIVFGRPFLARLRRDEVDLQMGSGHKEGD